MKKIVAWAVVDRQGNYCHEVFESRQLAERNLKQWVHLIDAEWHIVKLVEAPAKKRRRK